MIWFTSDTHFGHKNIAGPELSNWPSGYRDFSSVEKMDDTLINNINELVMPTHTLYHLGDWSFSNINHVVKMRRRINCLNVHLVLGNHDKLIIENPDLPLPIYDDEEKLHDIFSSVSHYKEVRYAKTKIVLSHYAMRVWNRSHHGSIHLYGHSHGTLPETGGKSMDVGVDSIYEKFGEYRPVSITEVMEYMAKKKIEYIDHHEKR